MATPGSCTEMDTTKGFRNSLVYRHLTGKYFWTVTAVLLVAFTVMMALQLNIQWFWLLLYAAIIVPFTPFVWDPVKYFRGGLDDNTKSTSGLLLLACSSFISWVFAKSIYNASVLGGSYGIVGGVSYMGYYTSFASTAIVIYFLRTRKGYKSLPEAVSLRYGPLATVSFGLAVLFRLFQEVWSNAIVVAGFYGDHHSRNWWLAACLSTAIPMVYCATGGMRGSLTSDVTQTFVKISFFSVVLIVLGINKPEGHSWGTFNPAGTCSLASAPSQFQARDLCQVAGGAQLVNGTLVGLTKAAAKFTPASCSYPTISNATLCTSVGAAYKLPSCALTTEPVCESAGGAWAPREMWSLRGGCDLLLVALLQGCLSYPFFDPVLTDRAFLAEPRTMLKAFFLGGSMAAIFILLFSFVGIYGAMEAIVNPAGIPDAIFAGVKGGQPAAVAKLFGTAVYSLTNLVFITSSLGVLDSTFSSAGKLLGPEFMGIIETGRPQPPQDATKRHMRAARGIILLLAVGGLLPLLAQPTALDATTVSGTVVMGLGPPIYALIFLDGYRPLTFHLPFWTGVAFGVVFQLSTASCCKHAMNVTGFAMGEGPYKSLLGFNVIGTICCWGLMLLTLAENPGGWRLAGAVKPATTVFGKVRARIMNGYADVEDPIALDEDENTKIKLGTPA